MLNQAAFGEKLKRKTIRVYSLLGVRITLHSAVGGDGESSPTGEKKNSI